MKYNELGKHHFITFVLFVIFSSVWGSAFAAKTAWVEESNAEAQIILQLITKYYPESAAKFGIEGHDEEIMDMKVNIFSRKQQDVQQSITKLQKRLDVVNNPKVRQDLEIMLQSQKDRYQSAKLHHETMLLYINLAETLFYSFHGLLDPRVDASRYPAALIRLKKYTGVQAGFTPITALAEARMQQRFQIKGLIGPYKVEVDQDLENLAHYIEGIKNLFHKSGLTGWQADFKILEAQLRLHAKWVKKEILPRTRSSNLLPEVIYADALKQFGVEMKPRELIERATFGYVEIRNEMRALAKRVAKQHGFKSNDYRSVILALKKKQLAKKGIIEFYQKRLRDLEAIIRREKIVSLPKRNAAIRLATAAESASVPVPHLSTPRLIGNTGEPAEFIIPLENPNSNAGEKFDDFSHDAATWTLTAHETRPGHELQFAAMIEGGVSITRAMFAFNSANVEGWALYAEAVMKEYLPLDGQLLSLHAKLMRAARAFLDPMLNLGMMRPEDAKQFLMHEVVLSEPMATQEIDRYTFKAPGQATSYYYGFMKLESLRVKTELALRDHFNQQAYHDFILAQGLLPPDLLETAVMDDFVRHQAQSLN